MATIAQIQAELAELNEQLTAAQTAYKAALANSEVQSYFFDSGEGKQSGTRRKPAEIRKEIESIKSDIASLTQKLNGTGIVRMNLRRRGCW